MINEFIVAAATDDGKNFIDRHFGDAQYYNLYRISPTGIDRLGEVENKSIEEEIHAVGDMQDGSREIQSSMDHLVSTNGDVKHALSTMEEDLLQAKDSVADIVQSVENTRRNIDPLTKLGASIVEDSEQLKKMGEDNIVMVKKLAGAVGIQKE
jgi:methyl-accepting chemotaxis protein